MTDERSTEKRLRELSGKEAAICVFFSDKRKRKDVNMEVDISVFGEVENDLGPTLDAAAHLVLYMCKLTGMEREAVINVLDERTKYLKSLSHRVETAVIGKTL